MRTVHGVDVGWHRLPAARQDAIRAWVAAFANPDTLRNVRLTGEGRVEADRYVIDKYGFAQVVGDEVVTEAVTYPVATPPPPEWWDTP